MTKQKKVDVEAPPAYPCDWELYHIVSREMQGDTAVEVRSPVTVIENKKTFFLARDEYVQRFSVEQDHVRGRQLPGTEHPPAAQDGADPWAWTGRADLEEVEPEPIQPAPPPPPEEIPPLVIDADPHTKLGA